MSAGSPDPGALIRTRRLVVCVGCGGVGKTTLSAAVALEAARLGRRSLVVTIDPARRLADALGIGELGNEPVELPAAVLEELGVRGPGRMFASMLDMKRTFDDLVERFADGPETRDRILQNPIYQHVSDALAGSAEYSAMEKVHELSSRREFDLIVVDTPPAQHALDFLEAPERLVEFLESPLVKLLVHPAFAAGRFGFRLFHRGAIRILRILERISGLAFLEDVSDFLLAFEGMSEGFRRRALEVRRELLGPGATYVLVAGPGPASRRQVAAFLDRLDRVQVPLSGVVVNRVRRWPGGGEPPARVPEPDREEGARTALARALAAASGSGFPAEAAAEAAIDATARYAAAVASDARAVAELSGSAAQRECFLRVVPELPADVHDLDGLAAVADHLFRPREAA